MKTKLLFTVLIVMLSITSSYASFPVIRTEKPIVKTEIKTTSFDSSIVLNTKTEVRENTNNEVYTPAPLAKAKDKWVGVAFWFFLGWPFAAHRWYYGKPVLANILFIITIGGLGVWAIIDLINILTDKF